MPNPTESPAPLRALVGWRLLALAYDFFPMLALWFITAGVFTAIHRDAVRGGWLGLLEFAVMWLLAGAYAVASWRRGGQTLGMRPWRLQLLSAHAGPPTWKALWLRYAVGTLSLLLGGLGFWWAWFDRDRRTWHDRASSTCLVRIPKP